MTLFGYKHYEEFLILLMPEQNSLNIVGMVMMMIEGKNILTPHHNYHSWCNTINTTNHPTLISFIAILH